MGCTTLVCGVNAAKSSQKPGKYFSLKLRQNTAILLYMRALTHALNQLQSIAANFYTQKIDRNTARSEVIDVFLSELQCSRVSLWRFDGEPGSMRLLCFAAKIAGEPLDTAPGQLLEHEYADYFDHLITSGIYVCHDALADAHLLPMRKNYLAPNHVCSLLDGAFMLNGRAYGMVCCEQTDAPRRWHADDVAALRAMVGKVALIMASANDTELWKTPSLSMDPIAVADSRPGRLDFGETL
jgi:GAF domain-containing protein